jgi:hypothetical protein
MTLQYEILFTTELLHKFFTDELCPDLSIVPSAETVQLLGGRRIMIRSAQNRFFAGIQTDTPGKPFILPEEGMQMSFFLMLKNPLFFNYTNLPTGYPGGKLYHFTNRNNNRSNNRNFLSLDTPYDNTKNYKPGDLALNPAGTIFEAIRSSMGITPPADNGSADQWMQVDPGASRNRYMSEADAVQWLPSRGTWHFAAPQTSAAIQVRGYKQATGDYSQPVLSQTINFATPATSFTLDLSALPSGKYDLVINGTGQFIYLSDDPNAASAFAVIDLFQESTLAADYLMLDGTGSLRSPLYSIYFLNRSTIWKYVFADGLIAAVTDNANIYQFTVANPPSGTAFSAKPIPLNEKALSLKLTVGSQNYSPIECASPQRLGSTVQSGDVYGCSEIFLNY